MIFVSLLPISKTKFNFEKQWQNIESKEKKIDGKNYKRK